MRERPKMKTAFIAVLFVLVVVPVFANDKPAVPCTTPFTVVQRDQLGNMKQGILPKNEKSLNKFLAKKYPSLCYVSPSQTPSLVFFLNVSTATYHGTRAVVNTQTSNTDGTVNGNVNGTYYGDVNGTYNGTYNGNVNATTTTTSTSQVPVQFNYQVGTLTIETKEADGSWKPRHVLQGDSICTTLYGVCVNNRHPGMTILENAVKWVGSGGLDDPLQSVN
jgi:hypothetical protein